MKVYYHKKDEKLYKNKLTETPYGVCVIVCGKYTYQNCLLLWTY